MNTITFVIAFNFAANKRAFYDFGVQRRKGRKEEFFFKIVQIYFNERMVYRNHMHHTLINMRLRGIFPVITGTNINPFVPYNPFPIQPRSPLLLEDKP